MSFLKDLGRTLGSFSLGTKSVETTNEPSGLHGFANNAGWFYGIVIVSSLVVLTLSEIYALHMDVYTVKSVGSNSASWGMSAFASVFIQLTSMASFFGAIAMKRKGKNLAFWTLLLGMVVIMGYECLWIIPHVPEAYRSIGQISADGVNFMLGVLYFAIAMLILFKLKMYAKTEREYGTRSNPMEMQLKEKLVNDLVKKRGYNSLGEMLAASVTMSDQEVNRNGRIQKSTADQLQEETREPITASASSQNTIGYHTNSGIGYHAGSGPENGSKYGVHYTKDTTGLSREPNYNLQSKKGRITSKHKEVRRYYLAQVKKGNTPSQRQIAEALSLSRSTVKRAFDSMDLQ